MEIEYDKADHYSISHGENVLFFAGDSVHINKYLLSIYSGN